MSDCASPLLVGMGFTLATASDPPLSEDELRTGRLRGCGTLVCSGCSSSVRSWPASRWRRPMTLAFPKKPTKGELREIKEVEAEVPVAYENAGPFLEASPWVRAYACRCLRFAVQTSEDLAAADWPHHWRCGGHSS